MEQMKDVWTYSQCVPYQAYHVLWTNIIISVFQESADNVTSKPLMKSKEVLIQKMFCDFHGEGWDMASSQGEVDRTETSLKEKQAVKQVQFHSKTCSGMTYSYSKVCPIFKKSATAW